MSDEKKRKVDEITQEEENRLKSFKVIKVLNENAQHKSIIVHGKFENGDASDAVVILEKTQFDPNSIEKLLSDNTNTDLTLHNDIYRTYQVYPSKPFNGVKSTLIYPATEKHIAKYSSQRVFVINETPDDYKNITLPYIESASLSMEWVYNILEKKTEADRIVFEDPHPHTGFILLPDMKWDRKQVTDLYLVALILDKSIKSLRNISDRNLPMLENIRDKGLAAISDKYGLSAGDLRIYVHYQPSYYHFHVHFTNVAYDAPGTSVGKAHLLDDIIDNVRICGDFYQRKTLTYFLRENEMLYTRFQEARKS